MTFLELLPKELFVILILSPLFVSVFLLAYFLKTARPKAEKHAIYWLVLSIIGSLIWAWSVLLGDIALRHLFGLPVLVIAYFSTYQSLRRQKKKR